jgi:hypothetical protein
MSGSNIPAIDCPKCLHGGLVTGVQIMTEPELDDFYDLLVKGEVYTRVPPRNRVIGWRMLPCEHELSVQDWVFIGDEEGTRLEGRDRVLLLDDSGAVKQPMLDYWRNRAKNAKQAEIDLEAAQAQLRAVRRVADLHSKRGGKGKAAFISDLRRALDTAPVKPTDETEGIDVHNIEMQEVRKGDRSDTRTRGGT